MRPPCHARASAHRACCKGCAPPKRGLFQGDETVDGTVKGKGEFFREAFEIRLKGQSHPRDQGVEMQQRHKAIESIAGG